MSRGGSDAARSSVQRPAKTAAATSASAVARRRRRLVAIAAEVGDRVAELDAAEVSQLAQAVIADVVGRAQRGEVRLWPPDVAP